MFWAHKPQGIGGSGSEGCRCMGAVMGAERLGLLPAILDGMWMKASVEESGN